MPKFTKYDLVRVVDIHSHDKEDKQFLGALGVIVNIDRGGEYPYEIVFIGKKLNDESEKQGTLLWKDYQLEAI